MSGIYDQVKSLQKQNADLQSWRDTMVDHLKMCRDKCDTLSCDVAMLTRENANMRKLLDDYAKAETATIRRRN